MNIAKMEFTNMTDISVAICTYNGAAFLQQQLASISSQTRLPNEIVICDDYSSDRTEEIVNQWIKQSRLNVKFVRNERRLGSTKNFEKAVSLCVGDIVLLSDQDDIWTPKRVELTELEFIRCPETMMVFGNALIVDDQLSSLKYRLWDERFTRSKLERFETGEAFHILLQRDLITGATMGFRACMKRKLLPIPELWVHDAWIAIICAFYGASRAIRENVILYRQHNNQQIGAQKESLFSKWRKVSKVDLVRYGNELDKFNLLLERISKFPIAGDAHYKLEDLKRKVEFCELRRTMVMKGQLAIPGLIRNFCLGNYSRYANGWKGAATDIMAACITR